MTTRRQIVIGFDGRPDGDRAVAWARNWALRTPGAVLHLTHALALPALPVHSLELSAAELFAAAEQEIHDRLAAVTAELTGAGLTVESHVRRWLPADTLLEQAEAVGASLIVLGQHGGRARRMLVGSTSGAVSREATVPVVVARGRVRPSPPGRVLVGLDGSAGSRAALAAARELFPDARFLVASVRDRGDGLSESELAAAAHEAGVEPAEVELHPFEGDAAAALIDLAIEAEVDLIAAGRRGNGPLRDLLLGSVSEKLLQLAPCPLLLAH